MFKKYDETELRFILIEVVFYYMLTPKYAKNQNANSKITRKWPLPSTTAQHRE